MSGASAGKGACPGRHGGASAARRSRVTTGRRMSWLLSTSGPGRDLRRRGSAGRQLLAECEPHDRDLLLLLDDDLLGEPLESRVLAVAQLSERHVDGTLVVRDHHAREVPIDVAREADVHREVHPLDGVVHHRTEVIRATALVAAEWHRGKRVPGVEVKGPRGSEG